jgi:effector-binding domain-containing protein
MPPSARWTWGLSVTATPFGGRTARLLHIGPYEGLPGAWQTLLARCVQEGHKRAGINWQIYENEDSAQPETSLYALLA